MNTPMAVSDEDLANLATVMFELLVGWSAAMFGLPGQGPWVASTVELTGAFEGHVTVAVTEKAAAAAAASMLGGTEAELSPADVADAVGEMANVIGGNLKGVVEGPCELGLPSTRFDAPAPTGDVLAVVSLPHGEAIVAMSEVSR